MMNQFQQAIPDRPTPITTDMDVTCVTKRMDTKWVVEEILAGKNILIDDFYSTGLSILVELKNYLQQLATNTNFLKKREFRHTFHTLSQRIFIEIQHNTLLVRKAPEIGWLKLLYPDISEFVLPFTDVQGLNSSWQWYTKGIVIPLIGRKIHPYYKTYFPTRFEHLDLFKNWIDKYEGSKTNAYDIGCGSGILTYKLLQNGFNQIYCTDSNINALIGIENEISTSQAKKIELKHGDFFCDFDIKSELIVFNPPWIPAINATSGLDSAIYYEKDFFERFFTEAANHLAENGKLVLIFSNLAQITGVCKTNPIDQELNLNSRFKLDKFETKKVNQGSVKTKRDTQHRADELVELWVLSLL